MPYRDLFWNYGPLPLCYYALWFKLTGVSINSVLLGRAVLGLLSGFFVFKSLALFVPLSFAALGAVWFWFFNPDFHFTYCYTPGITAMLGTVYALLRYVREPLPRYLSWAIGGVFVLGLIKVNFAITSLLGVAVTVGALDILRKTSFTRGKLLFWAGIIMGLPLAVLAVYLLMLKDLPLYEIYQCFPFLPGRPETIVSTMGFSVGSGLGWWLRAEFQNAVHSWQSLAVALVLWLSAGLTLNWLLNKTGERKDKLAVLAALLVLTLFYFLSLHEFLVSGIPYRTAWAQPIGFLIMFLLIALGLRQINKIVRLLLVLTLGFFVLTTHLTYLRQMAVFKNNGKFLNHGRGKLILANDPAWVNTVRAATEYLQTRLKEGETFYAVPYDPLYYFLTGKSAPSRLHSLYIYYGKLQPRQEKEIIAALENQRVNYILISNRQEAGFGVFGVDYGLALAEYIGRNFKPAAEFGDWRKASEWVNGHAVIILERVVR